MIENLPIILGVTALIIGIVGFASKLMIENEFMDILTLVGCSVAVGYMLGTL